MRHVEMSGGVITGRPQIPFDSEPLLKVFSQMLATGYLSGVAATNEMHPEVSKGVSVSTQATVGAIDWSKWTPGDTEAAIQSADGGLRALLDQAEITVKSINDTNLDRVGNLIANGLSEGYGPDEIGRSIRDFLDDPARAEMIASTETARAQIAGQSDQLNELGFSQFEWLASDDACEDCLDQAGIHDLGDDQPPEHPNCRCSIVGTGDITSASVEE